MLPLWVFLTTLAAAIYIFVGYPVLLGLWARLRARPVHKCRIDKPVSVLIAVHNGEEFIADKLKSVLALDYPHDLMEILVVLDGSTDQTASIVRSFGSQGVKLLKVPRGGKSAAINEAISHTGNEIILLTDVRQTLAPGSLRSLIDCFADPSVGVVSGELVIRKGTKHDEASTGLYWRYEFWIRKQLSSIDSIFGATGAIYAIRRELAVPLPPDILLDDMYLPLAAFFRGYRLIVEPSAKAFDYPTSLEAEFKRKVRTQAGNYQILKAYPWLMGPRNRMLFHYLSYKFARLLLPWIFAALLLSGCFLPLPWRWGVLAAQATFYGIAALDPVVPDDNAVKKWSAFSRTFVVLLWATLRGLSIHFVPAQDLWKDGRVSAAKQKELL